MFEQLAAFFRESCAELQKVTWLSRKEVMGSTAVIIVLVAIISVFVAFIDFIFARLVQWVI